MNFKIVITCIFILFSFSMIAQKSKTLLLDEVIDLSLQNSKKLKLDQSRIDEATAAIKEAMERKLPSANIGASYLRLAGANTNLKFKSGNSTSTPGESPSVSQAMYGTLNASLPIYNGGKIKYGIESSELLRKALTLDSENDREMIIQTAIESFANIFKATNAVRLVKENLKQSDQRIKELTNLEANGLLAKNDLLKAQLQSSNLELNLLDAENNLALTTLNMNLLLGLPIETYIIPDTSGIERKNDTRKVEDFVQAAFINRKDVLAIDARKKVTELGVRQIEAEKFPSIQLTGGYIAANIPGVISITNALNLGFGISYNIASIWKNKTKVDQATSRVHQMLIGEDILIDNIRLEVNKNYLNLMSTRKKVEVNAKAIAQSEENYRITKNKFDNSLATLSELLDAEVFVFQSKLAFTLAQADAFVSYQKLLQSAGLLAENFKK